MDQLKIGRFIALKRKEVGLTQAQLAEKLNVTDRAVSKWETGRSMPDSSIMLRLCDILKIYVNDLLCGEVAPTDYNKWLEKNLVEVIKQKEEADRRLLRTEAVIGALSVIIIFASTLIAAYASMPDWTRILIIAAGGAIGVPLLIWAIRIEQVAGCYCCSKCGHKYVPSFKSINLAPHLGRTRYLRCPECNQKSWQKKVISKD